MLSIPSVSTPVVNPLAFMARATPQLQSAIADQQLIMRPADFGELLASVRSIFQKYTAKLLEFPAGIKRGTALHEMMEQELKAAGQLASTCHRGCSGCCHYEVEITREEALILSEAVQRGVAIDRERLALQAARERQSPEWNKFFSADNRCVFLGPDNACAVYADRPSICRKHLVISPPANCTTAGAEVAPIRVLLAEILLSASLSLEGNPFGSLAKMLTEVLPSSRPLVELPDRAGPTALTQAITRPRSNRAATSPDTASTETIQ